jgi:hypothetical protein
MANAKTKTKTVTVAPQTLAPQTATVAPQTPAPQTAKQALAQYVTGGANLPLPAAQAMRKLCSAVHVAAHGLLLPVTQRVAKGMLASAPSTMQASVANGVLYLHNAGQTLAQLSAMPVAQVASNRKPKAK